MPDIEIVRTQLSPRCCCTSSVSLTGWPLDRVVDGQRVVDRRQRVGKLDVHHRTDDLNDFADVHMHPMLGLHPIRADGIHPQPLTRLAAGNLQQFLGDVALPQLVVFERQAP